MNGTRIKIMLSLVLMVIFMYVVLAIINKEKNSPCQAVCNKMFIQVIPEQLSCLKWLERILVSQRVLFKNL